jgi:hypothetical protein
MCFQELQANLYIVQLHLQSMQPEGQVVIDSTETGRVGSAIVTAPHVTILDQGSHGDGTLYLGPS